MFRFRYNVGIKNYKMKVSIIKPQIPLNPNAVENRKQKNTATAFCANPKQTEFIDKILNNKVAKGIFDFASLNPFGFNILMLATTCIVLRPATVMVVPGSNKEDKKYIAVKSIVASTIANTGRLLFCLPLAKSIEKLGNKAVEKTKNIDFPAKGTPRFDAYNFGVNNGFAFILSLFTTALFVAAVTKIMNKIMPPNGDKKNSSNIDKNKQEILPESFQKVKAGGTQ